MKNKRLLILLLLLAVSLTAYLLFTSDTASTPGVEKAQTKKQEADDPEPAKPVPQAPVFDKQKYSFDDPSSIWVVANKKRPLQPKSYAPDDLVKPVVTVRGTQYLRKEAAQATAEMFAAAKTNGLSLRVDSAYRSYTTQVSVYNNEVRSYGQATADTQSARPGHSEHQTGLAADFGAASGKCSIADCFAGMAEGKWLAANAYNYGFIMRYTPGKQAITGYRYEPWHFRYVGKELAAEMKKQSILTLEEFFGLPAAPNYN